MNEQRRAIAGTYSEFRQIKTRGVLQLIIEVPLEQSMDAFNLLGVPQPGSEAWVAVAPLKFNPNAPRIATADGPREMPLGDEEGTKLVQQAVLRCKEPAFGAWLMGFLGKGRPPAGGWPEDTVKNELCAHLGIESRRQIGLERHARNAWKALMGQYLEETRYGPQG